MIGDKLADRYQVLAEVGQGGMGVVYRARDLVLGRDVAIKVIASSVNVTDQTEQRFRGEAQTVAQLDHPSIVGIYDFGRHKGAFFYVMPMIEGVSLASMIKLREVGVAEVIEVGLAVAQALAYTHDRSIVHRDIKPENIMVTRDGSRLRVTVMDFGLAKSANDEPLTKTGILIGTVTYLSPEQVGGKVADAGSDIYSLGTVLYECLAHEPPFVGESQAVLYRIVHEFPRSLAERGIAVDAELEALVMSCLAKVPGDRPASMAAIGRALRQLRARHATGDVGEVTQLSAPLRRTNTSPFVGRQAELAELQQRLNRTIAGEGHFVVVGGDVGVGKTRLLGELEGLARARGITVLHGNLAEQVGAFPYFGFCEVLVDFFKSRTTSSERLPLPDLGDLAPDLVALFPTLGEIEALREAAGERPEVEAQGGRSPDNRTQLFETLARALVRLTVAGPMVLVFEDLHAADASIEALQYIVRRLAATPALIVATFRTTEVDRAHPITRLIDELRGSKRFVLLQLAPLAKAEYGKLLASLFGDTPISEAIAERFFEATEGNPFFTKEVVRALLPDKGEATADSLMMLGPSHLASALPATIQQAIDRRVSSLAAELREVLAVASVLGRSFDARDLEQLVRDVGDLDEALDRLIDSGLLEEERKSRGDRLSFVSGVVREVLYAQIPRRRRRSLHRRYAQHLERRYEGRHERVYAQLLHHFAEGDVPERTVFYGIREARHSLESFSSDEAIRAGRTALEFLDDEWEGDLAAIGEVHELLAQAYQMGGELDASLREAEAAIDHFSRLKIAEGQVRTLLFAARTAWQARRTADTRRWVELGIGAARTAGESEALGQLLALAATLAGLRGENDVAAEYLLEADSLDRKPRDEGPLRESGGRLVVALASPSVASEPAALQTQEDAEVLANVFETLLVTDDDGHLLPCLAERWEPGADGRSFRLALRADVTFHDGHAMTVDDVIASFERLIRLRAGALPAAVADVEGVDAFLAGETQRVSGLSAPEPMVLGITLSAPLPIYPVLLATPAAAIARISDESASGGGMASGTGPFRLQSLGVRSTEIERYDGYWRQPPVYLDAIEFRFVETARAMTQGLRSRELDIIRILSTEDLEDEVASPGFLGTSVEGPVKMTYFALFNALESSLCSSREVRQILSRTVPVQELVWQELGRFAVPAAGLIPSGILGYDPGRRRPRLSADGAALLREAGVEPGTRLRVLVFPVMLERYGAFFDAVCERWAALGLEIEVLRLDMGTFIATGAIPEGADVVLLRWGADYDDPDDFTYGHFHSVGGRWRSVFSSPESDRLLERGRSEEEPALRERIYREFEDLVEREGAVLPLFHAVDSRIAGPDVRGMRLSGSQPFVNYAELSKVVGHRRRSEPQGAVIRVPMRGLVETLDPIRGGYSECHEALSPVFESLTRRVGGAQIVPWLAESIEAQGGGLTYRIRLRRDITFHDGRRMTARDVRYSFERMLRRADATSRWLYAPIVGAHELLTGTASELRGLRIHSDHELTIELVRPLVYFPGMLSHSVCAIIPEGADRRGDRWQESPVGTGPFRVVLFDPGRRLELERAPGYWRPGVPRCRSLVFSFGASPTEIRSGFEAGRYAIAGEMLPEDVEALRKHPTYASGYRETPAFATYFIACNTRRGPLTDVGLRRQIADALDRPRLARQTLGRLVKPAQSLIPPGLLGYEAQPGGAEGLVDTPQTGSRDVELVCLVHSIFLNEYRAYFRRVRDTLAVLGVRLKLVEGVNNLYDQPDPEKTIDMTITRWFGDFPDAHTFCGTLHTREGVFGGFAGSKRVDRLLEKGQVTPDPQARHAIYRQIEELIAEDASLIPLFHPQSYRFARPEVEGLIVGHDGPMVAYEELALRGEDD